MYKVCILYITIRGTIQVKTQSPKAYLNLKRNIFLIRSYCTQSENVFTYFFVSLDPKKICLYVRKFKIDCGT
jgi:hypothetical protein